MIAEAYLTEWSQRVPWPDPVQIEQDLILSRMIVEIANHELLGSEFAFRGGTCLHKLHLPEPLRYSEDLDYVRQTKSGIKDYLNALREVAASVGLDEVGVDQPGQMVRMAFETSATITTGTARIRIRIETNIAETEAFLPRVSCPYRVESRWWSGEAAVSTFAVEELMSTKMRALYQRSKGRDLFDLWHVLETLNLDDEKIVGGFHHYMGDQAFTYPQLRQNLLEKLDDADFRSDLGQLVTDMPERYELERAADLVMGRLGSRLKNAPPLVEIESGGWRT